MADIRLISDETKKEEKLKVDVTFKDGEVKKYVCDFLGQSSEYSPIMVLLDEKGDETLPVAMINSNEIKHIDITVARDGRDMGGE